MSEVICFDCPGPEFLEILKTSDANGAVLLPKVCPAKPGARWALLEIETFSGGQRRITAKPWPFDLEGKRATEEPVTVSRVLKDFGIDAKGIDRVVVRGMRESGGSAGYGEAVKVFDLSNSRHACGGYTEAQGYGDAITVCDEDEGGRFWAGNLEYGSQVSFCPYCGKAAPVPAKFRDDPPHSG